MGAVSYRRTSGRFFPIPQLNGSQARRCGRDKCLAILCESPPVKHYAKAENLIKARKSGANNNKLKGLKVLPLYY